MEFAVNSMVLYAVYYSAKKRGMSTLPAMLYAVALDLCAGFLVRLVLRSLGIG